MILYFIHLLVNMASQEFDSMDILEIESACATGPQLEQAQNPWPHLNDYFLLKTVLIKGHMTSLNTFGID